MAHLPSKFALNFCDQIHMFLFFLCDVVGQHFIEIAFVENHRRMIFDLFNKFDVVVLILMFISIYPLNAMIVKPVFHFLRYHKKSITQISFELLKS
jgi:hypothetical protein